MDDGQRRKRRTEEVIKEGTCGNSMGEWGGGAGRIVVRHLLKQTENFALKKYEGLIRPD